MDNARTFRLRDPVHGLIVFEYDNEIDQLAWGLINTPEFQRLRRIKQLGVSEFVFPGATHTRFAHCIGVFHTARRLVAVIDRELKKKGVDPDKYREKVSLLAALLHDIGHGPFSHAFEHAYDAVRHARDPKADDKSHEEWTAEIILRPEGDVRKLLDTHQVGIAEDIAKLLTSKYPKDIYHSIVSSSFDADRLDYLQRDRLMTGSGAGVIDFEWLIDNLAVEDIDPAADDDTEDEDPAMQTPSFCLRERAIQAAEAFVLARWHLYCQVYLHKTTRCVEAMIQATLSRFADLVDKGNLKDTGVSKSHPMAIFFTKKGDSLDNYLKLDDTLAWSAISMMANATDKTLSNLASRLVERRLFKVLDCDSGLGMDSEQTRRTIKRVRAAQTGAEFSILEDGVPLSAYGPVKSDENQAHKRIMIVDSDHNLKEINDRSNVVNAIERRTFLRFFFEGTAERDRLKNPGGQNGK